MVGHRATRRWGAVSVIVPVLAGAIAGCGAAGQPSNLASALGLDAVGLSDAEMWRMVEEALADCMALEGWDYEPVAFPGWEAPPAEGSADERARLATEGIGVAVRALDGGAAEREGLTWSDPNTEYMASLPPAEAEAYFASRYGTPEELAGLLETVEDPETGTTSTVMSEYRGCQHEAEQQVMALSGASDPDFARAVTAITEEIDARFAADPRTVALDAQWSACMARSGFDYTGRDEYFTEFYAELHRRAEEIVGDGESPGEGGLTARQVAELEALLRDESAHAVAQFDCMDPMRDEYAEIYAHVEADYVEAHADELAALAASRAQRPADEE